VVWIDDLHFVINYIVVRINDLHFVKNYDVDFRSRGYKLWCVWTLHFIGAMNKYPSFMMPTSIIFMCGILNHLMMSEYWNDKWYHAMHWWNVIKNNSPHLLLTMYKLCITNILSYVSYYKGHIKKISCESA
jgi:hypothetical protein